MQLTLNLMSNKALNCIYIIGGTQRIDTTRGHVRGTKSHDVSENEKSSNGNQLPLNVKCY